MRKHVPTTQDIIKGRAAYAGLSPQQLRERVGITKSTWGRRMQYGDWTLAEIAAIDRTVHFTDDDIKIILRRQ